MISNPDAPTPAENPTRVLPPDIMDVWMTLLGPVDIEALVVPAWRVRDGAVRAS